MRFLSVEEIVRLHEALDACVAERTDRETRAEIIRLLQFSGCRKSEIKDLQRSVVCGDGKTGPRTVFLSADTRAVIDRQRTGRGGTFVFPSPVRTDKLLGDELTLWPRLRERTGLAGVQLHDLRQRPGIPLKFHLIFAPTNLSRPSGLQSIAR